MFYTHNIDPALVRIPQFDIFNLNLGPLEIRYYGLMYLTGFIVGYFLLKRRHEKGYFALNPIQTQDLLTWIMLGMMAGARIIYMFIYHENRHKIYENCFDFLKFWQGIDFIGLILGGFGSLFLIQIFFPQKLKDIKKLDKKFWVYLSIAAVIISRAVFLQKHSPTEFQYFFEIPQIWKGGLSFHGSVIGFVIAMLLFARKTGVGYWHIADNIVIGGSLGIFFGRLGNFTNGELWGRPTDVAWAVIFPLADQLPRHPSQLYQAFAEGLFVFFLLLWINKSERKSHFNKKESKKKLELDWNRTGVTASSFLALYGIGRFIVEFFREPDRQLGYYLKYFSMGQILCLIMIIVGFIFLVKNIYQKKPESYELKKL